MTGQTFNATANGATIDGQEPFDAINDTTFGNDTIFSFQAGDSHTTINIGSGTNNTVIAHTFDTIVSNASNGTFQEYLGHDNGFTLANGNYDVTLGPSDRLVTGNGNSTVLFYPNATNDVITLGNGNNDVNAGTHSGNFTVSVGTGGNTLRFFNMASGTVSVVQAPGAAPMVVDLSSSTLSSVTATITNAADVVVTDGSSIAAMTLNVAVDGYKPHYGATVNYVATAEAIAAPYNIAQPLPYFIAGLLFDPAPSWSGTFGAQATAPTLHFSFMQSVPSSATVSDAAGFATLGPDLPAGMTPQQLLTANANHTLSLSAAEVSAVTALANWAAVININFVSAADSAASEIRIGENSQGSNGSSGYAYDPLVPVAPYYGTSSYALAGDIYLNKDEVTAGYFNAGGYGGAVFAHEIGHALGMGGESGHGDANDTLPTTEDTIANTVMSYNTGTAPYTSAPQVFDVATIQYLYGPNPNYHPNASHVWTFGAGGGAGNLVSDGGDPTNAISAAGTSADAYIDLRPGHWDYLGAKSASILAPNQMMIDYGTVVTRAVAGDGNDTIVCNDANDTITCGNGNDTIVVGPGANMITGGAGIDTALFSGASSAYAITSNADGSITVASVAQAGIGADHLANVGYLQFTDKTIFVVTPDQANIARLYSAAFDRTPDSPGLSGWEKIYANDISAAVKAQGPFIALAETNATGFSFSIAGGFTGSSEFQQKYGTLSDSAFLTLLYQNILGRPPDPNGFNGWLNLMQNGDSSGLHYTHEMVLVGLAESPENIAKTSGDWLFTV